MPSALATTDGLPYTDYAVHIFHSAKATGHYKCFLRDDTMLPMMFLPDCIRATIEMMNVPAEKLKSRMYNVTAMSFTPAQLLEEMKRYYPQLTVEYEPDSRQQIGRSYVAKFTVITTINDDTYYSARISHLQR